MHFSLGEFLLYENTEGTALDQQENLDAIVTDELIWQQKTGRYILVLKNVT